ncbi:MAG: glycosyltransferase family 2 protein [Candidatus Micrarchaeota archaeon]
MGKLLSICIPTYTRKEKLVRLLENIAKEARGLEGEVEACVSDNGSQDGTQEYLEAARGKTKLKTNFYLSKTNDGFDLNVLRVLGLGEGKFLWLMGDDDLIAEGALRKLLEFLKELKNDSIKVIYLPSLSEEKGKLVPAILPTSKTSSFHLVTEPIGFMSAIVYRKSALLGLDKKKVDRGLGNLYMHSWLLRIIGLTYLDGRAIYCPFPACVSGGQDVVTNLARELKFSALMTKQYASMLLLSLAHRRYLAYSLKKLLASFLFPFFEILCERVFRDGKNENLDFGFFRKQFGIFWGFPYFSRFVTRLTPLPLADLKLRAVLFFLKIFRLTPEPNYGFWKEFWTKGIQ